MHRHVIGLMKFENYTYPCTSPLLVIDLIRILTVELELACNRSSCREIYLHFEKIPTHQPRLQASSSSIVRIRIRSIEAPNVNIGLTVFRDIGANHRKNYFMSNLKPNSLHLTKVRLYFQITHSGFTILKLWPNYFDLFSPMRILLDISV